MSKKHTSLLISDAQLNSTDAQPNSADVRNTLLISLIWLLMVVLVNPIGDFPLNDDWAYGWTVKTLLETGKFRLSDWTATNLVSQAILGALFCLPFGFSFTALRILTLILGLVGILATYGLLREVKLHPAIAFVGALTLGLNPIYFGLSNSFNSDIPSFTFVVLSLFLIVRALKFNSSIDLALGLFVALVSVLNRQSGIVILPAFGLALLVKRGLNFRTLIPAASATILGLFINSLYSHWLHQTGKEPLLYSFQIKQILETLSSNFSTIAWVYVENLAMVLVYLGLFLLPFLMVNVENWLQSLSSRQKQIRFFAAVFAITVGAAFIAKDWQLPFIGNVLNPLGLGPFTIEGYDSFLAPADYTLISRICKLVTLLGVIGATLLFLYLTSAIIKILSSRRSVELEQKWELVLALSTAVLYFLAIGGLTQSYWFDRYLLFLIPLFMLIVSVLSVKDTVRKISPKIAVASLILLLLCGGFTISATRDYLTWNRVRWQALNNLITDFDLYPNQIDGGFEFNGWYLGNRLKTCNPGYSSLLDQSGVDGSDFSCLWGDLGTDNASYLYRVGFAPKEGYTVENRYEFRRWLPWRKQELLVLKKLS